MAVKRSTVVRPVSGSTSTSHRFTAKLGPGPWALSDALAEIGPPVFGNPRAILASFSGSMSTFTPGKMAIFCIIISAVIAKEILMEIGELLVQLIQQTLLPLNMEWVCSILKDAQILLLDIIISLTMITLIGT